MWLFFLLLFHFLIWLSSVSSTGNSHVQWTVNEKICTLILKSMHGHLHISLHPYCRDKKSLLCMNRQHHAHVDVMAMHKKTAWHAWIKRQNGFHVRAFKSQLFKAGILNYSNISIRNRVGFMTVISSIWKSLSVFLHPFTFTFMTFEHPLPGRLKMLLIMSIPPDQMMTPIWLQSNYPSNMLLIKARKIAPL